jgi:tetratricopeptide (TPR) repeat protein
MHDPVITARFQAQPLPVWVRWFFVAIAVVVLAGWMWNARFISAYIQLRKAHHAMAADDLKSAIAAFKAVGQYVPEDKGNTHFAIFLEAMLCLREDRHTEALALLQQCRPYLPDALGFDAYISNIISRIAFDTGDYDTFSRIAQQAYADNPTGIHRIRTVHYAPLDDP